MPKLKPAKIDKAIGGRLKAAREDKSLALWEVAIKAGMSLQTLSLYERGLICINVARLLALAKVLGKPVGHFLGEQK